MTTVKAIVLYPIEEERKALLVVVEDCQHDFIAGEAVEVTFDDLR
jgi:hypothetical protein